MQFFSKINTMKKNNYLSLTINHSDILLKKAEFYNNSKETALKYYLKFVDKDANQEKFVIPDYKF